MKDSESKILQNILSTLKKNGEQINSLSDELSQIKQTKQSDTRSNKGQIRDKSQKSKNVECFRCHESVPRIQLLHGNVLVVQSQLKI